MCQSRFQLSLHLSSIASGGTFTSAYLSSLLLFEILSLNSFGFGDASQIICIFLRVLLLQSKSSQPSLLSRSLPSSRSFLWWLPSALFSMALCISSLPFKTLLHSQTQVILGFKVYYQIGDIYNLFTKCWFFLDQLICVGDSGRGKIISIVCFAEILVINHELKALNTFRANTLGKGFRIISDIDVEAA